MRRVAFMFVIAIMTIGFLSAATITVTKPATSENVGKSGPYTIKWNKLGTQNDRVKIRLFDSTGSIKVLDIVNDAPNSGSYEWTGRSGIADGNYVILVRTKDNLISGQSGVFSLGNGTPVFQIKHVRRVTLQITKPDFEVMEIYLDDSKVLRVVIRNIGNVWTGKLELKCGIGSRNFRFNVNNGNPKRYAKNHVSDMRIPEVVTQSDVSCPNPKVLLTAKVDPDNKIAELNEKNNVQSLMYPHNMGPDYIIKEIIILQRKGLFLLIKNQGAGSGYRGPVKLKAIDADTNGGKLNYLISKPDFGIPPGQEMLVYIGNFDYKGYFRVKAEIISGQFNCESTDKRRNNKYEDFLHLLKSGDYDPGSIYY